MVDNQSTRVTQVDPDALGTVARRISEAASMLPAGSEAPATNPDVIGHEGLAVALTAFAEAWTPALRDLAKAGAEIATHVQDTRHAYLATEQSMVHDGGLL